MRIDERRRGCPPVPPLRSGLLVKAGERQVRSAFCRAEMWSRARIARAIGIETNKGQTQKSSAMVTAKHPY